MLDVGTHVTYSVSSPAVDDLVQLSILSLNLSPATRICLINIHTMQLYTLENHSSIMS